MVLGWANTTTWQSGMNRGAIIGLMFCLSLDFMFMSMSTMFNNWTAVIVDVAIGTVMTGIVGAFIGWYLGRGTKAAA